MRRRLVAGVAITAAVLALGCYCAFDQHALFGPTIYLRNETGSTAYVVIAGDQGDEDDVQVPAWTTGLCATGLWTWHHVGTPAWAGNITAAWLADPSSASSDAVPLTKIDRGAPLYVRIDPAGVIRLGEPIPEDAPGCAPYVVRTLWESHE